VAARERHLGARFYYSSRKRAVKGYAMQMKKLNDQVTVAPQIALSDIEKIKDMGYKVLMCNRPDREDPGQPDWTEVEALAQALGLKTSFLPMKSREDALALVDDFRHVLADAEGPVFAYCRSGTRCEILWMTAQIGA